jgi:hypothetical protein
MWTSEVGGDPRFSGELQLMQAVAHRPVIANFRAEMPFFFYSEGVYSIDCLQDEGRPTTYLDTNHALLVVGYGIDTTTGMLYWKVMNFWGAWGESASGYGRIERFKYGVDNPYGLCGIGTYLAYASTEFATPSPPMIKTTFSAPRSAELEDPAMCAWNNVTYVHFRGCNAFSAIRFERNLKCPWGTPTFVTSDYEYSLYNTGPPYYKWAIGKQLCSSNISDALLATNVSGVETGVLDTSPVGTCSAYCSVDPLKLVSVALYGPGSSWGSQSPAPAKSTPVSRASIVSYRRMSSGLSADPPPIPRHTDMLDRILRNFDRINAFTIEDGPRTYNVLHDIYWFADTYEIFDNHDGTKILVRKPFVSASEPFDIRNYEQDLYKKMEVYMNEFLNLNERHRSDPNFDMKFQFFL